MSSWQKCITCGRAIAFQSRYYTCSVSTCSKKSAPKIFCSVDCWDIHVPVMNHKEAWAEENYAPRRSEIAAADPASSNVRMVDKNPATASASHESLEEGGGEEDILIVASKLKNYIRSRSGGMNTSGNVLEKLSEIVRKLSDSAIQRARADGRKTVMDRDF